MWDINGDPSYHINAVKEIISNGYTFSTNTYPLTHIYTLEFMEFTNIDILALYRYIPLIFNILFILFVYAFAKSFLLNRFQVILSLLAACSLIMGWYINFTPNDLLNSYIPIIIYILYKYISTHDLKWGILSILMIFISIPFHPLSSILILLILASINIVPYIFNVVKNKKLYISFNKYNIIMMLLLCIFLYIWLSYNRILNWTITDMYHLFVLEGGSSSLERSYITTLTNNINEASTFGYNVLEYFIKCYLHNILFFIASIIALPYIVIKYYRDENVKQILSLYGPIFALGIGMLILFLFNLPFGPFRILAFILIIGIILMGYILYQAISLAKQKNIIYSSIILSIIILVMIMVYLSEMLILYPSPYIYNNNYQTTYKEVEGMNWLLHSKEKDVPIASIILWPYNFGQIIYASKELADSNLPIIYQRGAPKVPYHFNYNIMSSLKYNYTYSLYLITSKIDQSNYIDVLPQMAKYRFTMEDFEKLNYDYGLNKAYSNSEFNVWHISN